MDGRLPLLTIADACRRLPCKLIITLLVLWIVICFYWLFDSIKVEVKMGFWDSFNASFYAYQQFRNSIRDKRFSLGNIDSAISEFSRWSREFEALRHDAGRERNPTAALGKIAEVNRNIEQKINQLLDLRLRLSAILKDTHQKIETTERSIGQMEISLREDYNQLAKLKNGTDAWRKCNGRIRGKEEKVTDMRERLHSLRKKASELESK